MKLENVLNWEIFVKIICQNNGLQGVCFDILNIDVDIDSFVNDRQNLCNCIHNKMLDWFECFFNTECTFGVM